MHYYTFLLKKLRLCLVVIYTMFCMDPVHAKIKKKAKIEPYNLQDPTEDITSKPVVTNKKKSKLVRCKQAKTSQDSFVREQVGELFRSGAQLGLATGLIFGLHQLTNKPFELSTLVGPIIASLAADPLKSIGRSCAMLFCPSLSTPRLNEAMDLKKQYARRKHSLSPSIQKFTEQLLTEHIWCIQRFDYYAHQKVNAIKEILQFPIQPKPVVPDTTLLRQFMNNYPEEVRVAIGAFVATIVEDATITQLTKKATPIMFVGPPGTGKMHLAKQLGTLLQLPVRSINVSNYKNIYGNHYDSADPEKGIIAEALIDTSDQQGNWSNKILILDEIDKALATDKSGKFLSPNGSQVYSFLHTLLERQEVAIPLSRYRNASPDISQIKIILIGNKTFTETLTADRATALESRIKIVHFHQGFTLDKKKSIAVSYINGLVTKKRIDPILVSDNVINAIMAEDDRLGLKGVRVLLSVINQYIDTLKHQKLIHEISATLIAAFDVKKAYALYHPTIDSLAHG